MILSPLLADAAATSVGGVQTLDPVETWIRVIERVGLPVGELVFFGFLLWQFCKWAAPLIAKLVEGHLAFMATTGDSLKALSTGQAAIERDIYELCQRSSPDAGQAGQRQTADLRARDPQSAQGARAQGAA